MSKVWWGLGLVACWACDDGESSDAVDAAVDVGVGQKDVGAKDEGVIDAGPADAAVLHPLKRGAIHQLNCLSNIYEGEPIIYYARYAPDLRNTDGIDCIREAMDCDTALHCIGIRPELPCEQNERTSCEDNAYQFCVYDPVYGQIFRRYACDEVLWDGPICEDEGCRSAHICASDTERLCENNHAIRCDTTYVGDRATNDQNCTLRGRTCEMLNGEPRCIYGACEASHCEGKVAVRCEDGGALERWDCSAYDETFDCAVVDGEPRCVSSVQDCESGARCEGETLKVCIAGHEVDFPCDAFPGGHCVVREGSHGEPFPTCDARAL